MSATQTCTPARNPDGLAGYRPDDEFGDLFRSLFEKSGMCIARFDGRLRVAEANPDFFHVFQCTWGETLGHSFLDFVHPGTRDKVASQFARLAEGRHMRFVDRMLAIRPGGSVFAGELTGILGPDPIGEVSVLAVVSPENCESGAQVLTGKKKLLTEMDARVLEGVAAGESTVRLATTLYLSRGGVEYHVNTLLRRLKVTNRPSLVSKAFSMGMFAVGSWPPRVLPEFVK